MVDRGRGRGSGRANGNNRRGGRNGGVCFQFRDTGRCNRNDCPFTHDNASQQQSGGRAARPLRLKETKEQENARAHYNNWKKFIGNDYAPTDNYTMQRVWKGAVAILEEDDRDWKQQLPQDLDDTTRRCNGRAHIKAILERRTTIDHSEQFIDTTKDFLTVVTHPSLLNDLAVDTYIGGIYNFISGVNGNRAVSFFQHLCETLVAIKVDDARATDIKTLEQSLMGLSRALCEVLRRDQRARLNEKLEALVSSVENAGQVVPLEPSSITSVIVTKCVGDIRAMIARAKGLVTDESSGDDEPAAHIALKTLYPRDVVVPGARHDNDKVDITEIIIFPTQDEIMSDAKECLPSTDPDQPHFLTGQVERHIDTNFRLLRHDVFGDMKKALAGLMQAATEDPAQLSNPKVNLGDMRVYHYNDAHVSYVAFDGRRGLEAQISFVQPQAVRKKSAAERCTWWVDSRRLEEGSLLSFIWAQNRVVQNLFLAVTRKTTAIGEEFGLSHHSTIATITTKLMINDSRTLRSLLHSSSHKIRGVLLEFPKVIPATFVPILESLQNMQRLSQLPFSQWILPNHHNGPSRLKIHHNIPPPLYARKPGFTFPLQSIMNVASETLSIEPTSSCDSMALIEKIENVTGLDRGQCKALIAALTREFAFVQGPPGTGKSYLGLQVIKILLGIKDRVNLGPIIIVCYTNHALDQFLEHLQKIGVKKILRVGGQSKSALLEGCNLRDVAQTEGKTRNEAWQAAKAYQSLGEHEQNAKSILAQLNVMSKHSEWHHLRQHIREKYPRIHAQFEKTDDDGFTLVGKDPFDHWKPSTGAKQSPSNMTSTKINGILQKANDNVHSLSQDERRIVIGFWVDEVRFDAVAKLSTIVSGAAEVHMQLSKIHDEADRRVLQGADVIGVTTSGLAKRISVLQHVRCKVIVCEEAGEVMEPHMLTALLPTVEHCIQIGDHEQLRPSINNFQELSLESKQGALHQLDRSQFERLSVGERGRYLMPVAQLEVQRRMRPEFSALIRQTIYPRLIDHHSTRNMDDVIGMRQNLFWLDHRNLESQKDKDIHHSKSKSNLWEVDLVQALVRHIVRQGVYTPDQIAVLTPYTGQLQKLRVVLRNDFEIRISERDQDALEKDGYNTTETLKKNEGSTEQQNHRRTLLEKKKLSDLLRLATVDNFQGEEAKIIIVSLVRSNVEGKVGFLKTSNRVNVLLSRAQQGMYLVGNAETYANVPIWQKVLDMLRASNSVGESLGLCCPKHREKIIEVQQPDDFANLSPEGGCREACTERLPDCGHQCQARCHSTSMHNIFRCEKPCQRRLEPCNHPCQKSTCGEDCGRCEINIDSVQLPCGHTKNNVSCYMRLDLANIRCDVNLQKQVPACQHEVTVGCFIDVAKESFKCPHPCGSILPCGHVCPGTCGQCKTEDKDGQPILKHLSCNVTCGRDSSTCNHYCPRLCHDGTDCGLCQKPCEVHCKHSRCMLKCYEPCAPCVEQCVWSCEHQGDCTMPCSAPCNRLPCDERCTRVLPCGHQCPSICGESCAVDYCQQCGMKPDEQPDKILFTRYADLDLDESPIIVLSCGHFFTMETLDGHVGLRNVYEPDTHSGHFIALIENAELAASIPQCPECRCPIKQHDTQRYNRLINRAVIDEMSKRFIVSGQQELQQAESRVAQTEINLETSRQSLISITGAVTGDSKAEERFLKKINGKLGSRYGDAINVLNSIKSVQRRMADRHQPAHKLYEAIVHAQTQNAALDTALNSLALSPISSTAKPDYDRRIVAGTGLLEIKTRCLVLEDNLAVSHAIKSKAPSCVLGLRFPGGESVKKTKSLLKDCSKFINDCTSGSFTKLAVEATLYYARVAQLFASSGLAKDVDRDTVKNFRITTKDLLEKAAKLCENSFHDRDHLLQAVNQASQMLDEERYEEVSKEELEAIKQAMVSGPRGIATHSGHWYKCANGHPFAVGECGMPMELACCPECGAPVGGQNHVAVAGVSRATEMEN